MDRNPNSESMIRLFEVMAQRVRAGEPWQEVLIDSFDLNEKEGDDENGR